MPVHQNVLVPTEADAVACPRGDIALVHCAGCGLVFNAAFDDRLTAYASGYDASQAHSPAFSRYLDELVGDLVSRHTLYGKTVVDIGCGDGNFLLRLCRAGGNVGVGFDPSHASDRPRLPSSVTVVAEAYAPGRHSPADLVCARHVIEHIERPTTLLAAMRGAVADRDDAVVFVETPRLEWILERSAFWDIFYEHCSYFTGPVARRLLEICGFAAVSVRSAFGGQYQWVEGRPRPAPRHDGEAHEGLAARLESFARDCEARRMGWRERVSDLSRKGGCVVWGAGAKGVTFLNALALGRDVVPAVVDLNPRKQGRYVSGTGQPVIAPSDLRRYPVASVLVMNPNYLDEIRAMARAEVPDADVVAL